MSGPPVLRTGMRSHRSAALPSTAGSGVDSRPWQRNKPAGPRTTTGSGLTAADVADKVPVSGWESRHRLNRSRAALVSAGSAASDVGVVVTTENDELERLDSEASIVDYMNRTTSSESSVTAQLAALSEEKSTGRSPGRVYGNTDGVDHPEETAAEVVANGNKGVADEDDDDDAASPSDLPTDGEHDAAAERKAVRRLLRGAAIYFESMPREVVVVHATEVGIRTTRKIEDADIIWIEATPWAASDVRALEPHQRVNSIPGMKHLSGKCPFGHIVNNARRVLGEDSLDFVPRTFVIPGDQRTLNKFHEDSVKSTGTKPVYVVKPDGGCGGDGIYLTNEIGDVRHQECVVQEYVPDPLLLGGLKWDLRLYVLVTSVSPLRFHVHREGLARMAVEKYEGATSSTFHKLNMHLTNYSLNKFSSSFVPNTDSRLDEECSKRSVSTAFSQLRASYPDLFDEESFWEAFGEIVTETLQVLQPHLLLACKDVETANRCFQLLGFDILVDAECNLHLLEINHHPSLMTDAPIDMLIKGEVLKRLVRMVSFPLLSTKRKKRLATFLGEEPGSPALTDASSWEERMRGPLFDQHDVDDTGEVYDAWVRPLLQLKDVFVDCCGGLRSNTYAEMGSTRLVKFARKFGIAGTGQGMMATSAVDLLYIKRINMAKVSVMGFEEFVDLLLEDFGDILAPETPPHSKERLQKVATVIAAGPSSD